MYPYLYIRDLRIPMTWLGIVISFAVFMVTMYFMTKKYKLSFMSFFLSVPVFILLTYLLGKYLTLIVKYEVFLPYDPDIIYFFLSPMWYQFNFLWILLWIVLYLVYFLYKKEHRDHKDVWIDCFFTAIAWSVIPLWLFLLLWDTFLWRITDSWLRIQSMTTESNLSKFAWVYPLWIFLSIAWFFSLSIKRFVDEKNWFSNWYLGFALLLFFLSIVFLYQNYPRRWVMKLLWYTVDIVQYVCRWLMIWMLLLHVLRYDKKTKQRQFHVNR